MLRGINKQQIFEEREDYEKFLEVLKSCKAISRLTGTGKGLVEKWLKI